MTTELNEVKDRATEATAKKKLAEEEIMGLRLIMQGIETEKRILQQEVQDLQSILERFRNTTADSVNNFLKSLRGNFDSQLST